MCLREAIGGRVASDSDVEDFAVDVLDDEEDVKRFEQKQVAYCHE